MDPLHFASLSQLRLERSYYTGVERTWWVNERLERIECYIRARLAAAEVAPLTNHERFCGPLPDSFWTPG